MGRRRRRAGVRRRRRKSNRPAEAARRRLYSSRQPTTSSAEAPSTNSVPYTCGGGCSGTAYCNTATAHRFLRSTKARLHSLVVAGLCWGKCCRRHRGICADKPMCAPATRAAVESRKKAKTRRRSWLLPRRKQWRAAAPFTDFAFSACLELARLLHTNSNDEVTRRGPRGGLRRCTDTAEWRARLLALYDLNNEAH